MAPARSIPAGDVRGVLGRHLLVDGFHLVVDLEASSGSWIVDARDGRRYLDCYTSFASAPLGTNPPELAGDPDLDAELLRAARTKPANPDLYSRELAAFVDTFARVLGDPALPHLFFVEGGALAVENALKVAFDWKSRRNQAAGRPPGPGTRVLHLRHAFHGRSGYTLSLTNTDPVKTDRFPTFDWPRIDSPALRFPLEEHAADNAAAEEAALAQADAAFAAHPHDIACVVGEPVQGEGGDRHLSAGFLGAVQERCRRHDALFVLDEVQTGVGGCGGRWAYEALGLEPDVVAFAKKAQVGGIMAGRRVDLVPDNVFAVPGRISSTWGGGLVDMVRSRRILEVIERDGLFAAAADRGAQLAEGLRALQSRHPGLVGNARGRGLMCAVDLPDGEARDEVLGDLRSTEAILALPCGPASVRFRPALTISPAQVDMVVAGLARSVARVRPAGHRVGAGPWCSTRPA